MVLEARTVYEINELTKVMYGKKKFLEIAEMRACPIYFTKSMQHESRAVVQLFFKSH